MPLPGEAEAWARQHHNQQLNEHFAKKEELRRARQRAFEERTAGRAAEREAKIMQPVKPGPSRFSTQYAIDWGRSQGWKLVDRENYDARTRRHRDLQLAVDALFDDGEGGMVGVQGAGRHERSSHWERFVKAGGQPVARRRGVRVIYLEFVRGDKTPVLREDWA